MIKKTYLLIVPVLMFSLFISGVCEAKEKSKSKESEKEKEKMQELIKKAKEELKDTTWEIELIDMDDSTGKKKKIEKDTLYFEGSTVKSDKLTDEGFPSTNYTVRVKGEEGDVIVWETMQTSTDKGIAFWRGELMENGVMRGVLSWHVDEKDKRNYTFVNKTMPDIKKEESIPDIIQEEKPQETPLEVSTAPLDESSGNEKMEEVKKKEEPKSTKKEKRRSLFGK